MPEPESHSAQMLIDILKGGDPAQRVSAARRLGHTQEASAIPTLIDALRDADDDVVREVIMSIGLVKDARALLPLLAMLRQTSPEEHSTAYISSLSPLASTIISILKAHPQEMLKLFHHSDPDIRAQVAYLLYKNDFKFDVFESGNYHIDTQTPFPTEELRSLVNDISPKVQQMALFALAEIADVEYLEKMLFSLADGDEEYRREMLLSLMGFCGKIQSENFRIVKPEVTIKLNRAISVCVDALKHQQAIVRIGALTAIANHNHPKIRKALRKGLIDPDPGVRACSIKALDPLRYYKEGSGNTFQFHFFHDKRNFPLLLNAMRDADPTVRIAVIQNNHLIKNALFYDALFNAANDSEVAVRKAAITRIEWDLGILFHCTPTPMEEIQLTRAKLKLLQLVHDDSADIRRAAIQTLAGFRDPSLLETLIPMFSDKSPKVRESVITSAHAITAPRGIAIVSRIHEVVPNKKYCMHNAVLELLQLGATDLDIEVRCAALQLLGAADSPVTLPILVTALQDDSPEIRIASIGGLANVGGEAALDALIAMTADPDTNVQYWAFVALQKYYNPKVIPALLQGLHSVHFNIRIIALKATVFCVFSEHEYSHYDYDDDEDIFSSNSTYVLEKYWAQINILIYVLAKGHEHRNIAIEALTVISGENFGDDVNAWKAWHKEQSRLQKGNLQFDIMQNLLRDE